MGFSLKRKSPLKDFERISSMKKQRNEDTAKKNDDYDADRRGNNYILASYTTMEQKDRDKPNNAIDSEDKEDKENGSIEKLGEEHILNTREINRRRAKEIRERKKVMVEEMQKQLILLTKENQDLRLQSQMQREEINYLRNVSWTFSSNPPPQRQTNTPQLPMSSSSNSDLLQILRCIGNTNNASVSDVLQGPRHTENVNNLDGLLRSCSGALPSSLIDLSRQVPQSNTRPFGL